MSWRDYIRGEAPIKGLKGFNAYDNTLKDLKNQGMESQDFSLTTMEMCDLIDQVYTELNHQGYPWTDWRESLTMDLLRRVKDIESEIDKACETQDRERLIAALSVYRETCLLTRAQQRRDTHE